MSKSLIYTEVYKLARSVDNKWQICKEYIFYLFKNAMKQNQNRQTWHGKFHIQLKIKTFWKYNCFCCAIRNLNNNHLQVFLWKKIKFNYLALSSINLENLKYSQKPEYEMLWIINEIFILLHFSCIYNREEKSKDWYFNSNKLNQKNTYFNVREMLCLPRM